MIAYCELIKIRYNNLGMDYLIVDCLRVFNQTLVLLCFLLFFLCSYAYLCCVVLCCVGSVLWGVARWTLRWGRDADASDGGEIRRLGNNTFLLLLLLFCNFGFIIFCLDFSVLHVILLYFYTLCFILFCFHRVFCF